MIGDKQSDQRADPQNAAQPSAGATIVVVEDDPAVQKVLTTYLRAVGFRTRGFGSAEEFLAALDWAPAIDCIVSDLRLPQADGLQLMAKLKAMGLTVPVILITGHGEVQTAVDAMKLGASDFIQKPLQPKQLETAIRNAIVRTQPNVTRADEIAAAKRKLAKLSERQAEIVDLIVSGLTSKEIGLRLQTSHRTIEAHRLNIFDKLEITSLAELVRLKVYADLEP